MGANRDTMSEWQVVGCKRKGRYRKMPRHGGLDAGDGGRSNARTRPVGEAGAGAMMAALSEVQAFNKSYMSLDEMEKMVQKNRLSRYE